MKIARAYRGVIKPSSELSKQEEPHDLLVHLDLRGRLIEAHPAFLSRGGRNIELAPGYPLGYYLDAPSQQALNGCLANIRDGQTPESQINLRFNGGKLYAVSISLCQEPGQERVVTLTFHPLVPEADPEKPTSIHSLPAIQSGPDQDDYSQMLERHAAQLTLLNRIGQELFLTIDLGEILSSAVQRLQSNFGYFHVAIYVPDAIDGRPVMEAKAGTITAQFPPRHSYQPGQGLVGWVFQHRETVLVDDVSLDPRCINLYPDRIPTRSELVVPIQTGEQFFGALEAISPLEYAFDQNDVSVFETVSRQLALGIENANLYHQVSIRLQQQERAQALMRLQRDLLAGLSANHDFNEVLNVVLDTLTHIEGIDSGSIYLVDETGGLDMVTHKGLTPAFASVVSYLPPEANKTQFVLQGHAGYMRYADLPFDPRIPADVRSHENLLSLAVLPILHQFRVIANLTLGSHTRLDFPPDARDVLESVAAQLGATIARIQAEKALAANQAHSTALLQAIPDTILVIDSTGRLHHIQQSVDSPVSFLTEKYLGKPIQEALPPKDAAVLIEKVKLALSTKQIQMAHFKVFSDEEQHEGFLEIRISPVDEELAIVIIRNGPGPRPAGGETRSPV